MTNLNPFRVSFDRPLGDGERKRARIAATIVSASALVLGVAGVGGLLNASSGKMAAWSNATPEPEVRILAREGEDPAGKSCDDQTWPYIEQRCLKRADAKAAERSTPKHGLGAQSVVLPSAPQPAAPRPKLGEPETTGAASPRDTDQVPTTAAKASPQQAPQPDRNGSENARPAFTTDSASQRLTADPRLSAREVRRLQWEERKRLQREQAKRVREARSKARAESREARRSERERIVRRWTEFADESPSGGSRRVIIIRPGSLDDDFFR